MNLRLVEYEELQDLINKYERSVGNHIGYYSLTPIAENMSCMLFIDFFIKSERFGYYALAINGKRYSEAVPVNAPINTPADVFESDRISLLFYDLRHIKTEDVGSLTGQSLESRLNLTGYEVTPDSPVSLEAYFELVNEISGVKYGVLRSENIE